MTCAYLIGTGVNRMLMATLRQAEGADGGTIGTIMIFAIILVLVAAVIFFAQRYKRCPPDQVMVIYGRTAKGADGKAKPSRVVHGGAAPVSYTHLTLPTSYAV